MLHDYGPEAKAGCQQPSTSQPFAQESADAVPTLVYNLARRLLGDDNLTEEAVVTVLLKLSSGPESPIEPESLNPWLYRETLQAIFALRRKRGRQGSGSTRKSAPAATNDAHAPLEEAISCLPERYRDVFVLGDVERLSLVRVADLLRLGLPLVQRRLHRARMLVRDMLPCHLLDTPSSAERRAFPRHRLGSRVPVRLRRERGRRAWIAVPEDVSAGGLRILARLPQPVGQILELEPTTPHNLGWKRLTFRLTRCQPADGGYQLAGRFLTPLAETKLDDLT